MAEWTAPPLPSKRLTRRHVLHGALASAGLVVGQRLWTNFPVVSVGKTIMTELSYLQFPPAAANALVLLITVVLMLVMLTRLVDIRKEL